MGRNSSSGPVAPTRQPGWTPLYETQPPLREGQGVGDGSVVETGTTIVGLTTEDSVVLVADRRASVGGGRFVTNKDVQKVESIHPTAAMALSGAVGHIQQFVRNLRAESALYEDRRDDALSIPALATLAGNILRSEPLQVTPLLGGIDDEPHVFGLDGGGGVLSDEYAAGGSGMQVAYGHLENQYESGLSVSDASGVAARAIEGASERDTASGNGITVAVVDDDGVEIDEYDACEEVVA